MQQLQGGELAVHDGDNGPPRQPAMDGEQHQARPLGHGAVVVAMPLRPRLARGQRGQHRQPLRWHSNRYAAGTLASSAQMRPANGTSTSTIALSQRRPRPVTFTSAEERDAS